MTSPYQSPEASVPLLDSKPAKLRNLRVLVGFNIFIYGSGFALLLITFFGHVLGFSEADGKIGEAETRALFMPSWILSAFGLCGCWGLWRLKAWGVACYIFVWLGFQIQAYNLGLFFPHNFHFTWSDILAVAILNLIQFGIPICSVFHFWRRRSFFSAGIPFKAQQA